MASPGPRVRSDSATSSCIRPSGQRLGGDDVVSGGACFYANWNIGTSNSGHRACGRAAPTRRRCSMAQCIIGILPGRWAHCGPAAVHGGRRRLYCVGGSRRSRNFTFRHCLGSSPSRPGARLPVELQRQHHRLHPRGELTTWLMAPPCSSAARPTDDRTLPIRAQRHGRRYPRRTGAVGFLLEARCRRSSGGASSSQNVARRSIRRAAQQTLWRGLFCLRFLTVQDRLHRQHRARLGGGSTELRCDHRRQLPLRGQRCGPGVGRPGAAAWLWTGSPRHPAS